MTVGLSNTALLDLPLPVEGYFDGSWGNLVNYALTDYLDIAIAGTLTLTGDGAVTLTNTAGDDGASNITSTTAQYAAIKVTGTLTTTKVITAPSTSKIYVVDNAATGGAVTFKASGQTGVSVAVGEKCAVYFNGTDYVKVASSVADGVTSVSGTGTVNGITLTGTVTSTGSLTLGGTLSGVNLTSQVTGTLPIANGGTGTTSTTFVNLTSNVTGTLPVANGGTGITSLGAGVATFLGTPSSANLAAAVSDETGTGALVFANSPTLVTPALGTPASGNFSSGTFTWPTFNQNTTGTAAGLSTTLAVASGGTGVTTSTGTGSVVLSVSPTFTGVPAAPTASNGTSTTQLATTAFVQNSIAAISAGVTSFSAGTTGLTPSTGTSGNVTLAGTLAVANGGTGVTSSTGTGSVVLSNTPTLFNPILGTPTSGNLANCTFPTLNQNTTGTAAGLSSTLAVTSGGTGVTTATGFGSVVLSSSPTLVSPNLGTPTSGTLTSCTGLPIGSGVSGLGSGISTALAVSVGTAGAPVVNGGVLGTPSSGNLANCTFPTLNQNTTGTAASTPKLLTSNFTIEESGGNLIFKYGATTIASMTSAGVFTTLSDINGNGTP